MVFKRSEYGRRYREPSWEDHKQHYQEKVNYRLFRRQLEHHHNFVEWDWDTESEEELRGKSRRGRNTCTNNSKGAGVNEGRAIAMRGLSDREVQTPDWEAGRGDGMEERIPGARQEDVNRPVQSWDKTEKKGSKKLKQTTPPTKTARPKTSPSRTTPENAGVEQRKPPMLAYGWADSKRDVGGKKTFNIRASGHGDSSQVFPAALRAMRRNEFAIKYREEQRKRENLRMRKMRAAFNVPPPDDYIWMSEYQRNFTGSTRS